MAKLTRDNLRILPPAAKYLKKLKDKKLKNLYQEAINQARMATKMVEKDIKRVIAMETG